MADNHMPEDVVAPLLAVASACVMFLATDDEGYERFVEWSKIHVTGPKGFKPPTPPKQASLAMAASMLVDLANSNMTPEQATYLAYAKIIAEGGFN